MTPKWVRLQEGAFRQVDAIDRALKYTASPIPLLPAAQLRHVEQFVFGQLSGDGGLIVNRNGFELHVDCKESEAKIWERALYDPLDGGRSFPARTRFTVAHELAHTFFYDLSKRPPLDLVPAKRLQTLDSLERTCNRVAARLLIPESLLPPIMNDVDCFDAERVLNAARTFRVSPATFISRLTHWRWWHETGGLALYAEEYRGRLVARAIAVDTRTNLTLGGPLYGEDIAVLLAKLGLTESQTTKTPKHQLIEIPCRVGTRKAIQTCKACIVSLSEKPNRIILTAHLIGIVKGMP